jgi:CheY-like chemotaxis protein
VRLFRRMLRSRIAAPDCLEAYSGDEALRLAEAARPDLMLLSLEISRGQGRQVLAQVAAHPALAGLPIILTSGQSTDYLREALPSPIQLSRAEGFQLAEVVQTLEAMFSVLAPGWRRRVSTGPGPAAAPLASPALADTPPRPASSPTAAR